MHPLGVYVHFPFCLQKCGYCDFVSYETAPAAAGSGATLAAIDHEAYADAVIAELDARAAGLEGYALASVFFGGGTPSLWEPRALGRVLDAVRRRFGAAGAPPEVTVECNPSSLDGDRARALVDVGVDRLSVGVQAFDDARLRHLGRLHSADEARATLREVRAAGVPRLSADLIYAVGDQTPASAAADARELADLGVDHVSAYALIVETGTRFGELARRGRLPLADDGAMVESFFAVDAALAEAGLEHYEVSNFARPGERARHNVGYWRGDDYLGLGCAAYGTLAQAGGAMRWRNVLDPARYAAAARGATPLAPAAEGGVVATVEALDAETRLRERIMLGLRMRDGLDLAEAAAAVGCEPWPRERARAAERLVARGRLVREGDRLRVPHEAYVWVDDTAAALF